MLAHQMTQRETTIVKETINFVDYVFSFYGKEGVYDMGATIENICEATKILIDEHGSNVAFDSLDRERVRDIMIEKFNLQFPKK